jgi:hypothetical protein
MHFGGTIISNGLNNSYLIIIHLQISFKKLFIYRRWTNICHFKCKYLHSWTPKDRPLAHPYTQIVVITPTLGHKL